MLQGKRQGFFFRHLTPMHFVCVALLLAFSLFFLLPTETAVASDASPDQALDAPQDSSGNDAYPYAQQVQKARAAVKEITGFDGTWVDSNHEAFCIKVMIPDGAPKGYAELSTLPSFQRVHWYDYQYLPNEELPLIGKTQELFFWFYNNDELTSPVNSDRFDMARKVAFALAGCEGSLVESNDDVFCVQVVIPENAFAGALHIPPTLESALNRVIWDQYAYEPGDLLPLIGKQQSLFFWFRQQADVSTAICKDLALLLPSERKLDMADEKQLLEFAASDALFPATGVANLQLWEQDEDTYCVLVMPLEDTRTGKIDLSKIPRLARAKVEGRERVYRTDEKLTLGDNNQGFLCWFNKADK